MARVRYIVTHVGDGDDVWVGTPGMPDHERVAVWRTFHKGGTVDTACASCSTALRGMSASCVHAKAAKYATMHGTVVNEKVPQGWKPLPAKPKVQAPPPRPPEEHPPIRQPSRSNKLEIDWKCHQPSAGPSVMRAYVGAVRIGNVTRSLSGKGYIPATFLPGATCIPSMFTEHDAMAEVERVTRLWFEDIPGITINP